MQTLDGPQLDLGPVETVEVGKKCVSPKFGFVKKTANTLSKKYFSKNGDVVQCGTAFRIELRRRFSQNNFFGGC